MHQHIFPTHLEQAHCERYRYCAAKGTTLEGTKLTKGRTIETCLEIGHKSHHSPAAAIIYVSNIYVHPPLSLLLLLLLLNFSALQENKTKCSSCSSPSDSHSGTAKSTSFQTFQKV